MRLPVFKRHRLTSSLLRRCPGVTFYLFSSLVFFGFFSAELQSNTKASLQENDFVKVSLLQLKLKCETLVCFLRDTCSPSLTAVS